MMNKLITYCLPILFLTCPVHGATDQEREVLTRLLHELEALNSLVDEADRVAYIQKNPRTRFDYQQLRQDLNLISQGVADHVNAVRREPHVLPQLDGSYND